MSSAMQLPISTPATTSPAVSGGPQSEALSSAEEGAETEAFLEMLVTRLTGENGDLPAAVDGEEAVPELPPAEQEGNILPVVILPAAIAISSGTAAETGAATTGIAPAMIKNSPQLSPPLMPQTTNLLEPELLQPEEVLLTGDGEPELQQVAMRLPQLMMAAAGKKESPDLMPGILAQPSPAVVVGAASNSSTPASAPPSLPLSPHMNSPQWQNALGERMVWMVKRDIQQAELRLNPKHLGPVEVRIEVRNEQANITFSAHHAVTRDALEAAVPRLREMLGDAGLTLANADVSQQQPGRGQQQEGESRRQGSHSAMNGVESHGVEEMLTIRGTAYGGSGLIDIFA